MCACLMPSVAPARASKEGALSCFAAAAAVPKSRDGRDRPPTPPTHQKPSSTHGPLNTRGRFHTQQQQQTHRHPHLIEKRRGHGLGRVQTRGRNHHHPHLRDRSKSRFFVRRPQDGHDAGAAAGVQLSRRRCIGAPGNEGGMRPPRARARAHVRRSRGRVPTSPTSAHSRTRPPSSHPKTNNRRHRPLEAAAPRAGRYDLRRLRVAQLLRAG